MADRNSSPEISQPWITLEEWNECTWPVGTPLGGKFHTYVGLGAHGRGAVTAAVLEHVGCSLDTGKPQLRVRFASLVTRKSMLERRDCDAISSFARRGWIQVADDEEALFDMLVGLLEQDDIADRASAIGGDNWLMAPVLNDMRQRCWPAQKCSYATRAMVPAAEAVADAVRCGSFIHFGHPLMEYMLEHAWEARDSRGNIYPCRHSASDHIDGPLALVMAMQLLIRHGQGGQA